MRLFRTNSPCQFRFRLRLYRNNTQGPNRKGRTMKRGFLALLTFGLVAGLSACTATLGDKQIAGLDAGQVSDSLTRGETTKEEVQKQWGAPSSTKHTPEGEVWGWKYTKRHGQATDAIPMVNALDKNKYTKKRLAVTFDKDGVVKDYSFSDITEN